MKIKGLKFFCNGYVKLFISEKSTEFREFEKELQRCYGPLVEKQLIKPDQEFVKFVEKLIKVCLRKMDSIPTHKLSKFEHRTFLGNKLSVDTRQIEGSILLTLLSIHDLLNNCDEVSLIYLDDPFSGLSFSLNPSN